MPKNNSSKSPAAAVSEKKPSSTLKKHTNEIDEIFSAKKRKESPLVVPEKKHSSTSKKPINEIDEIFSNKKRKRAEEEVKKVADNAAAKSSKRSSEKMKKKKESGSKGREFAEPHNRSRKKTGDGLVIYTEDELGIGKSDAGGTRLCPFDCECCF